MATETIDRGELINEIWKHKGKISLVARKLDCSVRTIYYYAEKYATVQNAIDAARQDFDEILLDNAEVGLQKQVVEQRAWAIRYVLDKKGYDRGYLNKQQIEHEISKLKEMTDDELRAIVNGSL